MTTFRADVVTAIRAILGEQMTATPDLLKAAYTARPGNYNITPLAFIGPRDESITHDSGTRTRVFDGLTVYLLDSYSPNDQVADRLDQLVDALVDRFDIPANVSRVPGTIIELTSVASTEIEVTGTEGQPSRFYPGAVLTFGRTAIKEGRQ